MTDDGVALAPAPTPGRVRLLTPGQAAAALRVAPRTVARWADDGRLAVVRTPGGHRRYRAADVAELLLVTSAPH